MRLFVTAAILVAGLALSGFAQPTARYELHKDYRDQVSKAEIVGQSYIFFFDDDCRQQKGVGFSMLTSDSRSIELPADRPIVVLISTARHAGFRECLMWGGFHARAGRTYLVRQELSPTHCRVSITDKETGKSVEEPEKLADKDACREYMRRPRPAQSSDGDSPPPPV